MNQGVAALWERVFERDPELKEALSSARVVESGDDPVNDNPLAGLNTGSLMMELNQRLMICSTVSTLGLTMMRYNPWMMIHSPVSILSLTMMSLSYMKQRTLWMYSSRIRLISGCLGRIARWNTHSC